MELSQFLIFNSAGTGGDEERVVEEAEFLSSEEVDPGHLLQLTSVVIDFWYIHTDGCTCCVIDSLLKCENRENG